MSSLRLEFQLGSPHLPELGLWLDAHEPQTGAERVFVSHAHSDHIAAHREVILSEATAKLMEARLPGTRHEHILKFGERKHFNNGQTPFDLTLLPAGHMFGSAMSWIEAEGGTLLYTGDFKLRPGLSAEPCEPRTADLLIMETTYGQPQYVFPPADSVLQGVVRFCREALDNGETAVLLGYSLGKSQELLCGLGDAGLPLMLHAAVHKLTRIYEAFGQCFPKYEPYHAGSARGKVLLCPPNVINSAMLRNLGKRRTAILTGWAVDPNCRFRYQCDAAFPLSDHADFPGLIEMVKRVQPKKVYTLHGFAADFARTLRDLGFDAQSLSEDEQLALPISAKSCKSRAAGPKSAALNSQLPSSQLPTINSQLPTLNPFETFALTCSRIAADSSKLEKIRLLAEYLRGLKGNAIGIATTWFSGRPFPATQNKVLQLGWAVLRDALCSVGRMDAAAFNQVYLKHSDLGETASEVLQKNSAAASLSLEQVDELFQKLHATRGPLAKTPLLAAVLARCTPMEAKYLVKIITGDLRIGLKEGLVEDAVASAFSQTANEVRQANLLLGDIGETAKLAAENRLSEATLVPFRPIKFMLASPEETATDVWDRMQPSSPSPPPGEERRPSNPTPSVWLEDKYDGIRCQLHKVGQRVALYSRDLKEMTSTFFELADAARTVAADFILDGEIVAMREDEILPFAELQKRLGRREDDLFMSKEVPIKFVAFDLFWLNGQSYLDRPLRERRPALEKLSPASNLFRLAQITQASSAVQIEVAFDAARSRQNEGLMIKNPESVYAPGRRGLAWLKLKKAFATLDCVVIGAEYGHGKRNKVLSDYTFAVRDEETGELKTIGKAYSGLTDVEIAQLTEHFLKQAKRQQGRYFEVEPDTVLEIAFDKLQRSDRHTSGLAMRFPRIVRIRTDKSVAEIDTLASARILAEARPKPLE
ncbi:MAG: ligase 1 [Verrucomicrobiota bacterium]